MKPALTNTNTNPSLSRGTIDWAALCEAKGIVTQTEAVISSASTEDKLWPGLLKIACQQLKGKGSKRIGRELVRLKSVLDARLGLSEPAQAYWEGDFLLFCHFIRHWAKCPERPPILDGPPWTSLERNEAERRYDDLLARLLAERGCILMEECLDYQQLAVGPFSIRQYERVEAEVGRWEKELNSLAQLARGPHPQEPGQQAGFMLSFINAVLRWLTQLLHVFSPFKNKPTNVLDSLTVLNRIASLAMRYHLVPRLKKKEDSDNKLAFLKPVYEFDLHALRKVNASQFKPSLIASRSIQQLRNQVKADLRTLTFWSTTLLNDALLFSEGTPEESLDALLRGFKLLREKVQHLSSELYACRMQAEQVWRQNRNYLIQLDKLDNDLILFEDGLVKLQRDWLHHGKEHSPFPWFRKACECLELLLSDEMLRLEGLSWAEYTCYFYRLSEGNLTWEMNARNQRHSPEPWFIVNDDRAYHLRYVFTRTDYLMTIYTAGHDNSLGKMLTSIQADKLAVTYPKLKSIAEYCCNEIDKQRKRLAHVNRGWYAGQWFAPTPSPKQAIALEYPPDHAVYRLQEPSLIEKPEVPLGFGIVRLHQAYLNWANSQSFLTKSTRGSLGPQHILYEGNGEDELSIKVHIDWRRAFLAKEKERMRREKEQAEAEEIKIQQAAMLEKEKEIMAKKIVPLTPPTQEETPQLQISCLTSGNKKPGVKAQKKTGRPAVREARSSSEGMFAETSRRERAAAISFRQILHF